jgi:hypothetical protein
VGPVLLAVVACVRAGSESASPRADTTAAAVVDQPVPCDDLAQRYCEALALPCANVRGLLVAAATEASRCAAVDRELAALERGAGPDAYAAATAESLQRLLDEASLDAGQVDEILGGTDEPPTAKESLEIACPTETTRKQRRRRAWCEGDDGLPHGPFLVWNARGEIVQHGRYDRGRVIDPGFIVPESRDVPWDAFACPDGTSTRSRVDGDERSKWCERPGGTLHGPMLVWRDGLVTRFTIYDDGRETRSFSLAD